MDSKATLMDFYDLQRCINQILSLVATRTLSSSHVTALFADLPHVRLSRVLPLWLTLSLCPRGQLRWQHALPRLFNIQRTAVSLFCISPRWTSKVAAHAYHPGLLQPRSLQAYSVRARLAGLRTQPTLPQADRLTKAQTIAPESLNLGAAFWTALFEAPQNSEEQRIAC